MPGAAHILLVDDNRMDVELTLDAFRELRSSTKVDVVGRGPEVMDYLLGRFKYADRKAYPLPDLILLDLKMLAVDGFDLLRQIKGTSGPRRIPVIVLTSSMHHDDCFQIYDAGANSYLVKPVSFAGFMDLVRHVEDYWLKFNIGPPKG